MVAVEINRPSKASRKVTADVTRIAVTDEGDLFRIPEFGLDSREKATGDSKLTSMPSDGQMQHVP